MQRGSSKSKIVPREMPWKMRSSFSTWTGQKQMLDKLSRKFRVQESELKRDMERANLAEKNLKSI